MRIVALDFETTGTVEGLENEPWQLGLVEIGENGPIPESKWETLFHIGERPFSPRAVGRYAQIRHELSLAPETAAVWPEIADRLNGATLVAHNIGTERTMLTKMAPLAPLGPWVDTLKLVRKCWPLLKSYALGDVIRTFGLNGKVNEICPGRTWHDALYDACAGAVLYCHILQFL